MRRPGSVFLGIFIMVLTAIGTFWTSTGLLPWTAKIEAQSPQRFQPQSRERLTISNPGIQADTTLSISAICDSQTGTLLYVINSGSAGSWGVSNGCQKNPR
jgi:hypothetical protein